MKFTILAFASLAGLTSIACVGSFDTPESATEYATKDAGANLNNFDVLGDNPDNRLVGWTVVPIQNVDLSNTDADVKTAHIGGPGGAQAA